MPKSITGLIFDKDGVIVDFHRTWAPALMQVVHELAGDDAALKRAYLTAAGFDHARQVFKSGSAWAAGNTDDVVQAWARLGAIDGIADLISSHCAGRTQFGVLSPLQLTRLLSGLKIRGHRLGVATNDSQSSARCGLDHLGALAFFETVIGHDSVAQSKPAPDMVYQFCHDTGLEPGDVAVIGDNPHDMEMASRAGAGLRIGVLSGTSARSDLAPISDHVIATIAELPQVLP